MNKQNEHKRGSIGLQRLGAFRDLDNLAMFTRAELDLSKLLLPKLVLASYGLI